MTTTLEIKDGVIKLPTRLQKKLEKRKIALDEYRDNIYIHIIPVKSTKTSRSAEALLKLAVSSRDSLNALHDLKGIIKNRKGPDPVKWQREIRKEWDRKII